jgi:G:T-mismatch repair DNA endonuclease (very short patch repair protein)
MRNLKHLGWRVLVIWECPTWNPDLLVKELQDFLRF